MTGRTKWVNGEAVPLTEDEEAARDADEAAWEAAAPARALADARTARAGAYPPLADQLDAIWKQLAAERAGGKALAAEADAALEAVLAVKRDIPLPK